MKILIVTTAFPRWQNDGRAPFILETAMALQRQGHQIRVIAMHNPGTKNREFLEGIEIIRPKFLPEKMEILQSEGAGLPQAWKSNYLARLAMIPFFIVHTFATAYWSRGFDIIHANWTLSGLSACLTRWIHKIPIILTVHGSDVFRAKDYWILEKINRYVFKNVNKIIAVSETLKIIVNRNIDEPNKTVEISNGIDLHKFTYSAAKSREPYILFVGSLIERKGVDTLIRAFAEIAILIPTYKLIIIGDGILREELGNLCMKLGVQQKVVFLGHLPPSIVHEWMTKSRVFVLPSREEGQGVVLLEALASGTPCVGSRVGGIPGILSHDVGSLFTPGDPHELGRAVLDIVLTDKWDEISKRARSRIEKEYNIDVIASRILNEYSTLLSKNH